MEMYGSRSTSSSLSTSWAEIFVSVDQSKAISSLTLPYLDASKRLAKLRVQILHKNAETNTNEMYIPHRVAWLISE